MKPKYFTEKDPEFQKYLEEVERAQEIVKECLILNRISCRAICSAVQAIYAYTIFANDFSLEQYEESMNECIKQYKQLWESE